MFLTKYYFGVPDLLANGLIVPPAKGITALGLIEPTIWLGGALLVAASYLVWRYRRSVQPLKWPLLLWAALSIGLVGATGLHWAITKGLGPERLTVLQAMKDRPNDPWPSGLGHIPLGALDSPAYAKAFVETGGSISPWFRSFGLALWRTTGSGALVSTDSLDAQSVRHGYIIQPTGELALSSVSDSFRSTLSIISDKTRQLHVEFAHPSDTHAIGIRSVGPAGSALESIRRTAQGLLINDRWTVRLPDADAASILAICLGIEGQDQWKAPCKAPFTQSVDAPKGWAYAIVWLKPGTRQLSLTMADAYQSERQSPRLDTRPLEVEGLPADFTQSLQAQWLTLRQGINEGQLRPGDAINYPLEWLRDNAYHLVALARHGDVQWARKLGATIAERDFFGGFGAEGDNPGLAIWALNEIAKLAADPAYDRELWPHVIRKLSLIEQMQRGALRLPDSYGGPKVPEHQLRTDFEAIANAPSDGLINGRMDLHFPRFYTTATAYKAYISAAELADRLADHDSAKRFRAQAQHLQQTWNTQFAKGAPDSSNERNAIFSLWPAEIAQGQPFEQWLQKRWATEAAKTQDDYKIRNPWSYFAAAEAHQWLWLGDLDKVWATLGVLWQNSTMPGLYTLWEGTGEENSFRRWRTSRGWVAPHYVTPHYWSASELLLLQQSMLGYVRSENGTQILKIAPGFKMGQISSIASVKNLGTEVGFIDWAYGKGVLTVRVPSSFKGAITAPPSLPANTPLIVERY
jgi:hypothetical protein